jgi:phage shock protein A
MMGLINRLRRITRGRIEAFLDSVEDPAAVIPQLVEELAAKVRQAANAEAKALASVKSLQRRLDEATGRVLRLERGAQLAVKRGEDDLARQAVALLIEAERDQSEAQKAVETAGRAHAEARAVRRQLADELESLRARQGQLVARARQAKAPKAADLAGQGRSLLDEVARMKQRVEDEEATAQAHQEVAGLVEGELSPRRLEQLLRDEEVQSRLDELRRGFG